jgi:hypothetical protein
LRRHVNTDTGNFAGDGDIVIIPTWASAIREGLVFAGVSVLRAAVALLDARFQFGAQFRGIPRATEATLKAEREKKKRPNPLKS